VGLVDRSIALPDSGGRAVDDHVDGVEQIAEAPGDREPSVLERGGPVVDRGVQVVSAPERDLGAVIRTRLRYADEFHIRLGRDRVRDAFPDRPVPVDAHAYHGSQSLGEQYNVFERFNEKLTTSRVISRLIRAC